MPQCYQNNGQTIKLNPCSDRTLTVDWSTSVAVCTQADPLTLPGSAYDFAWVGIYYQAKLPLALRPTNITDPAVNPTIDSYSVIQFFNLAGSH